MTTMRCIQSTTDSDEVHTDRLSTILSDYSRKIAPTDRLPAGDLTPVLMGLFGEIGGILAAAKKRVRDKASYAEYDDDVEEEFGDALWYFAALCRRLDVCMESVVDRAYNEMIGSVGPASSRRPSSADDGGSQLVVTLVDLGTSTAALLRISACGSEMLDLLRGFWSRYIAALRAADIDLEAVVNRNIHKACGRFLEPDPSGLPTFDQCFPADERLPDRFEIKVTERPSRQTYLQWNGVFIGAPLTDNIAVSDGYRYHDVFHLAHAAILHWSPTFRSLIKHKRKTDSKIDEAQDGGRAIVVEEGLTAWIFARAKRLDYFASRDGLSFDLLKTVQQFVRGYEVEACPLFLWEKAILQGYDVFRKVRANNGGVIVGDRSRRTICFRSLTEAPV